MDCKAKKFDTVVRAFPHHASDGAVALQPAFRMSAVSHCLHLLHVFVRSSSCACECVSLSLPVCVRARVCVCGCGRAHTCVACTATRHCNNIAVHKAVAKGPTRHEGRPMRIAPRAFFTSSAFSASSLCLRVVRAISCSCAACCLSPAEAPGATQCENTRSSFGTGPMRCHTRDAKVCCTCVAQPMERNRMDSNHLNRLMCTSNAIISNLQNFNYPQP